MRALVLCGALLAASPLLSDPPSDNIWGPVDAAFEEISARETALRNRVGSISFGPDYDPTDGRLTVTSDRGGELRPLADLMGVFDRQTQTFYWGWSAPETRGFRTNIAESLRATAAQPLMADVGLEQLDVSRPRDASGLAMLGVTVSDGQMLQFFEYGTETYYVLLTFDDGA